IAAGGGGRQNGGQNAVRVSQALDIRLVVLTRVHEGLDQREAHSVASRSAAQVRRYEEGAAGVVETGAYVVDGLGSMTTALHRRRHPVVPRIHRYNADVLDDVAIQSRGVFYDVFEYRGSRAAEEIATGDTIVHWSLHGVRNGNAERRRD